MSGRSERSVTVNGNTLICETRSTELIKSRKINCCESVNDEMYTTFCIMHNLYPSILYQNQGFDLDLEEFLVKFTQTMLHVLSDRYFKRGLNCLYIVQVSPASTVSVCRTPTQLIK